MSFHAPAPARRPASVLRRCACGGKAPGGGECEECRSKRLQRQASASGPRMAPPLVHDVLRSPGTPLDPRTRATMEPAFGTSFAGVRIHAESRAAASAEAVGARAYTVGRDVVFAAGRYAPASADGQRLIAHELAHVVQQSGGADAAVQPSLEVGPVDAPEEREADAAADAVLSGGRASLTGGFGANSADRHSPAAATLRRQPDDGPFGGVGVVPVGDPRSLKGSINPALTPRPEVRAEAEAIRRWLAAHPGSAQEPFLQGELARLEAFLNPAPTQTSAWDAFAPGFNREFADVLNAFAVPATPTVAPRPSGATGDPLTPARLQSLFTPAQRDKLIDFIATKRIPERLFNGTDKGATTAQQRILLAAHILANGIYRPGSFDQRVHAQFCYHWVQIVHHYAGATPPGSGNDLGVMGSFDPLGAAVLGTGKGVEIWHKPYVFEANLPAQEEPGVEEPHAPKSGVPTPPGKSTGTGPLHPGTLHEEAARKAAEANPGKASRFHRQPSFPIEKFDTIQTGDWLWYYNANASEGGAHSVIFSHWTSGTEPWKDDGGALFRWAEVWSQPTAARGGVRHPVRLGDRFVPNLKNNFAPHVVPITHIWRVTPDSGPATTAAEMLPGPTGAGATKLAGENEAFIKAKEKKLKVTVDRKKLKQFFRDKNGGFLVSGVEQHLSAEQLDVLVKQVNWGEDLEALIRLYQKLRVLYANARALDTSTASTYGRLNAEYATAKTGEATAGKDIAAVDVDLKSVAAQSADAETRRAKLDVQPRIDSLVKEAATLERQMWKMTPGKDRDAVKDRRQDLLKQADAERGVQRVQAPDLAATRGELAKLAARKRELEAKRAKLVKTRDAIKLPYGLVHPGTLSNQDMRSGTTGRLSELDLVIDWPRVSDPAPAPAAPLKKP